MNGRLPPNFPPEACRYFLVAQPGNRETLSAPMYEAPDLPCLVFCSAQKSFQFCADARFWGIGNERFISGRYPLSAVRRDEAADLQCICSGIVELCVDHW